MTDIVLINPRGVNDQYPPLSILTLAAYVRMKGFSVAVIDTQGELLSDEETCNRLKALNPVFCGLTFMTYQTGYVKTILPKLKAVCPNTIFLAGGVHASICPEQVQSYGFNYVVIGEGEATLTQMLHNKTNNLEPDFKLKGVYRKEGFEPVELIPDLDTLPMPAWDLVNPKWYKVSQPDSRYRMEPGETLTISTSRGCRFFCAFCCWSKVFGRTHRLRSAEKIVEELEYLVKHYSITKFFFVDDCLLGDKKRAEALANLLLAKNLKISFSSATRVTDEGVNLETLVLLKKAGLCTLDLGVESGSDKVLKDIHKGITVEQIKRGHALTHQAGIRTTSLMMVGHLTETWQDFYDSLNLYADMETDYVNWSPLTPFPGTEVHELAKAEGWIRDFDWSHYLVDGWYRVMRTDTFSYEDMNGLEQLSMGVTDVMMKYHKNKPVSFSGFYQLLGSNYPLGLNAEGRYYVIKRMQTGERKYLEKLNFSLLKLSKTRHTMERAEDVKLITSVRKHPTKLLFENNRLKRIRIFTPLVTEYITDKITDYFARIRYAWRLSK
jgi:anaerobic magnesium-protoporphyrin IX monomethyl ester cyclase